MSGFIHAGDAFLPGWARGSGSATAIAHDSESFAARLDVRPERGAGMSSVRTNALGLRITGGGHHVQRTTHRAGGGDGFAKQSEKEVVPGVNLVTSVNSRTRARLFEIANKSNDDVEITLGFNGSTGVTLDGAACGKLSQTTNILAGETMVVGSIMIAPGNASVRMALSCKTMAKNRCNRLHTDKKKNEKGKKKKESNTSIASSSSSSTATTATVAAYAFTAAEGDECTLSKGDEVLVKSEDYKGWISILNLTTGKEGLVPTNHLALSPMVQPRSQNGSANHVYNNTDRGIWTLGSKQPKSKFVQPQKYNHAKI